MTSNTWPLVIGDVPAQFSVMVVPLELIVSVKPPGKLSLCLARPVKKPGVDETNWRMIALLPAGGMVVSVTWS